MAPTTKTPPPATDGAPPYVPDVMPDGLAEVMAEAPAWDADAPGPSLLAWKTSAVMGEVHRVRKTGRNDKQHYDFAKEGDIADMVRVLLAKYRVGFRGSMLSCERAQITSQAGNSGTLAMVRMQMTLTCADTGEVEESYWEGDATDYTDKAVPKAITACKKSWLIFRFLISTGDEEADQGGEPYTRAGQQQPRSQQQQAAPADGPDTRPATKGQVGRLFGLARDVPFLVDAAHGGGVDKAAVHDLCRWVVRDDVPANPVASLNDLTRDEIERVFATMEHAAQNHEYAGAVAAAVDEWVSGMGVGAAPAEPEPDTLPDVDEAPGDPGYGS